MPLARPPRQRLRATPAHLGRQLRAGAGAHAARPAGRTPASGWRASLGGIHLLIQIDTPHSALARAVRAAVRERARLARPHPGARGARRTVHGGQRRGRNPPHLPQASPPQMEERPASDERKARLRLRKARLRSSARHAADGCRRGPGGEFAGRLDSRPRARKKSSAQCWGARFARQTAPAGGVAQGRAAAQRAHR